MGGRGLTRVATGALLLAAFAARAETALDVAVLNDAEGGQAFDLGVDWLPNEDWAAYLGLGTSTAEGRTRDFDSDAWYAGMTRRWAGWSVGADLERWRDSTDTESEHATLRVERRFAPWRVAFSAGQGELSTTTPDPASFAVVEERFDRRSYGVELERAFGRWRAYARAARHDYSPDLDEFDSTSLSAELTRLRQLRVVRFLIATGQTDQLEDLLTQQQLNQLHLLLQNQGLAAFDRLIAYQERRIQYVGSLQTLALGLVDQGLMIGFERRGARGGAWRLEYERSSLPIDGLDADTLSTAWRWETSPDSEFTLRLGVTDAEGYERAEFVGLTLRFYFE